METNAKFIGAIDEIGGIPQEDVRGMVHGVDRATLSGGNDDMVADTADVEGKEVSGSTIG